MKFRLIESIDTQLVSQELIAKLTSKFGKDFDKRTICKDVSEYVYDNYQPCEKLMFNISVWNVTDDYQEPISVSGHCVIRKDDVIYDYTSNQYADCDGVGLATTPRVLHYDAQLSKECFGVRAYRNGTYVITTKEKV
jgi:hypothetical protein